MTRPSSSRCSCAPRASILWLLELPDFRGELVSSPTTHSTSTRLVGGPTLLRADAFSVAVPSGAVVEGIDVVGDVRQCEVAARIDALLDPFILKAAEEGLRYRIVPAVAVPAHTRLKAIGATEASPCIAAALGPLIGVNIGPPRPPLLHG